MANANAYPVRWGNNKSKVISGSFAPNGSSAVAASSVRGYGFSVARAGAGRFTITLNEPYISLISASVLISMSAATDLVPQIVGGDSGISTSTGGTIEINTNAGATPTDIAANAANRIYFTLELSQNPVTG